MWCAFTIVPKLSYEKRLALSEKMGFQNYLVANYSLSQIATLTENTVESWEEVPIPKRRTRLFEYYKRYIENNFKNTLLPLSREVHPGFGFEARLDAEPIPDAEGKIKWVPFDLFMHEGLRASYWSPQFGFNEPGLTLTATQALGSLEKMLKRMSDNGKQPNHIVDQLNFIISTEGFEGAPKIGSDQFSDFF